MKDTIRKRIDELESKRDKFITQANLEVAAYNGAIQELRQLLQTLNSPVSGDTRPVAPPPIGQGPYIPATVTSGNING